MTIRLSILLAAIGLVLVLWFWVLPLFIPPEPPPPTPPPTGPGTVDEAQKYWVSGSGRVLARGEREIPGEFEAEYYLSPGGGLRISRLKILLDDTNVVIRRLLRRRTVPLRCTDIAGNGQITGSMDPSGEFTIPPGAAVAGFSYSERNSQGQCPGAGNSYAIDGASTSPLGGRHDPVGNKFTLSGNFDLRYRDETIPVEVGLNGFYVNRPPKAQVASIAEGLFDFSQGGCPPVEGNPPAVGTNDPEGLRMILQSASGDPDGKWNRSDIQVEQWDHLEGPIGSPTSITFLGRGRRLDERLFRRGVQHTVVLTVFDHRRARSTARCEFFVGEPL